MKMMQVAAVIVIAAAWATPAAAQRYTAKQNGELVELTDATAQMNVSVVWSMSNAWRVQVKGKDLVRTSAELADFKARPGFNGVPLLAPFASTVGQGDTANPLNTDDWSDEKTNTRPPPARLCRQLHDA